MVNKYKLVRCSNYKDCLFKSSCPHVKIHKQKETCEEPCVYYDDNSNCKEIDKHVDLKENKQKENKMIVQYIKDKKGKLGCLVGLSDGYGGYSLGWSKFNRSEEIGKFDKEKAKNIAIGRAVNNTDMFEYNAFSGATLANFPASFANDINDFMSRCDRYFHTDKGPANFNWER